MAQRHLISNVDAEVREGDCTVCGRVRVWQVTNAQGRRWSCSTVRRRQAQRRLVAEKCQRYGIDEVEFNRLLTMQQGQCAVCHVSLEGGRAACVDHDHKTGKVRGLLCVQCNWGLGHFKDDPEVLRRASEYLCAG